MFRARNSIIAAMRGPALVFVLLLAAFMPSCALESSVPSPPERAVEQQPNIVLVMTDDLSARLLNRHIENFPNVSALEQSGVTFDRAFVTNPVCCPSRATSLTGLYTHDQRVEQIPGEGEVAFRRLEAEALPVWLDSAGYATGYIGPKYLNNWDGTHRPPGWDRWSARSIRRTEAGVRYVEGFSPKGRNAEGETHTEVFSERAATFVREALSRSQA